MKVLIDGKPGDIRDLRKKYLEARTEVFNNVTAYVAEQTQYNTPILKDGTDLADYVKVKPLTPHESSSGFVEVDHPAAYQAHEYPYDDVTKTRSNENLSQTGGVKEKFLYRAAILRISQIKEYVHESISRKLNGETIQPLGIKSINNFPKSEGQ